MLAFIQAKANDFVQDKTCIKYRINWKTFIQTIIFKVDTTNQSRTILFLPLLNMYAEKLISRPSQKRSSGQKKYKKEDGESIKWRIKYN